MKILLSLLLLFSLSAQASIGGVILHEGTGQVERSEDGFEVVTEKELDIFSDDIVKTGKGKTAIQFVDDTRVDITEHSKLIIDAFVYDPETSTGSLSIKASLGTIRYASGLIAKNSKQNVKIQTPTATIGVRGTDFSMTVDELGGSTIILLPSCDTNGNCFVGEIDVTSDAGQVILNQAFQATVVTTVASAPMKPVILDLDEDMINNLLIVSKPKEIAEAQTSEYFQEVADMLDVDFLQFEDLEIDYLEENETQWATGLDIDFLEQNFLVDLLKVINEQLALVLSDKISEKETVRLGSGDPSKVKAGKDPITGILVIDDDPMWIWEREAASGNKIQLVLDKEYGYLINVLQGDYEIIDYELGGSENAIAIIQSE
jgi:hypothetical protein